MSGWPLLLTLTRFLLGPLAAIAVGLGRNDWGFGLMAMACLTDVADGRIARARRSSSIWGGRLDVLADATVVLAVAAALVAGGAYPPWIVLVLAGMLAQFVWGWRSGGIGYDPVGRSFGAVAMAAELVTLAVPADPVPIVAAGTMAAVAAVSLATRIRHRRLVAGH